MDISEDRSRQPATSQGLRTLYESCKKPPGKRKTQVLTTTTYDKTLCESTTVSQEINEAHGDEMVNIEDELEIHKQAIVNKRNAGIKIIR